MAVRHGYGKIAGTDALVFAYDTGDTRNSYKGKPTTNFISNPTEEMPRGEFGQYRDLAPTFETYGLVPYSLSMDIKANKPGNVYVYMQNGSTSRHGFVGANVSATTEYQRFYFENLTPTLNDPGTAASTLATYTGYGSGVNPTVKNIQLELGAYSTPFVSGTRSSTQGLLDITGNYSIDLSNVSFDSNAMIDFDGTNDFITLANTDLRPGFTLETVCYPEAATFAVWGQGPTIANRGLHIVATNSYRGFVYGMYANDRDYGNYIPTLNQWYHWVFTYNGTSFVKEFFANGQKQTPTASVQNEWIEGSSALRLGTNYGSTTSYSKANGKIAVAKYYNRPLTDAEIVSNYRHYKTRFNI